MEINDIKQRILNELRLSTDGIIGNITLQRNLKISPDSFFEARNELIDEGKVTMGRGKGGATKLVDTEPLNSDVEIIESDQHEAKLEKDLYPDIKKVIAQDWVKDKRLDKNFVIEITANQGRKRTGGKWSRPDITIVALKSYQYQIGRSIEVITFEVKPKGYHKDKTGVFETASHSLFSHYSYLVVQLEDNTQQVDELIDLCNEFGVGLITFLDPANWETWYEQVEPDRKNPDPDKIDQFINVQMDQTSKNSIIRWK